METESKVVNYDFDDPLFGGFEDPMPDDLWEPSTENTTTIVHTEPAPETLWDPVDHEPDQPEPTIPNANVTHVPDQSQSDADIHFDMDVQPQIDQRKSPTPVLGKQMQQLGGDFVTPSVPDEAKSKPRESPKPPADIEKSMDGGADKRDSPEVPQTAPDAPAAHETGTLKSKNKRRKHKKRKTQS
ncbi:unnamed protein product [Echinostoma caproni]|uniref:DUF4604 domain-containing protein n=1 Tax=Echinostoma caproni TaxID=27848 RepID=A0A183AGR9_9TREM|nr:unnamed protein product [Echinostoma caproni]